MWQNGVQAESLGPLTLLACEYSRLSFARATTCESRRVTLRDSHVVAGANERRLYSQAITLWEFVFLPLD